MLHTKNDPTSKYLTVDSSWDKYIPYICVRLRRHVAASCLMSIEVSEISLNRLNGLDHFKKLNIWCLVSILKWNDSRREYCHGSQNLLSKLNLSVWQNIYRHLIDPLFIFREGHELLNRYIKGSRNCLQPCQFSSPRGISGPNQLINDGGCFSSLPSLL